MRRGAAAAGAAVAIAAAGGCTGAQVATVDADSAQPWPGAHEVTQQDRAAFASSMADLDLPDTDRTFLAGFAATVPDVLPPGARPLAVLAERGEAGLMDAHAAGSGIDTRLVVANAGPTEVMARVLCLVDAMPQPCSEPRVESVTAGAFSAVAAPLELRVTRDQRVDVLALIADRDRGTPSSQGITIRATNENRSVRPAATPLVVPAPLGGCGFIVARESLDPTDSFTVVREVDAGASVFATVLQCTPAPTLVLAVTATDVVPLTGGAYVTFPVGQALAVPIPPVVTREPGPVTLVALRDVQGPPSDTIWFSHELLIGDT